MPRSAADSRPLHEEGLRRERHRFDTGNYDVRRYRHADLALSKYLVRKAEAAWREAWRRARQSMLRSEAL